MSKKFKCDQCEKYFKRKHTLSEHKKIIHSKLLLQYKCKKCNAFSKSLTNMNIHIGNRHNPYFKTNKHCSFGNCKARFKSMISLKKHSVNMHSHTLEKKTLKEENEKMISLSNSKDNITSEEDYYEIVSTEDSEKNKTLNMKNLSDIFKDSKPYPLINYNFPIFKETSKPTQIKPIFKGTQKSYEDYVDLFYLQDPAYIEEYYI